MLGVLAVNLLLRNRLESAMNQYMTHHRVSLGYAHLKLFSGMIVLRNLTILQKVHPSSPIMHLGEARMSVQWSDLIRGHIVASCIILAPTVELTAAQLKTEVAITNLKEIRRAILEAPNIGITRVEVREFNFAYADATRRIDIAHLNVSARDLRRTTLRFGGAPEVATTAGQRASSSRAGLIPKGGGAIDMPELALSMARFYFTGDAIRYRDTTPQKGYGLSFESLGGKVFNLTNQTGDGPAQFALEASFMSSGRIYAAGHIRPFQGVKDLDLTFKLSDLQLRSLNPLFRQYGHKEVAAGQLSVNSHVTVRADHVSGFVEPVLTGLKVATPPADKKNPSLLPGVFQSAIKGTTKLLSASPHSVSPRVDLSGPVDKGRPGLGALLVQLGQKSFLNGFEPSFNSYIVPQS
jgi:uncharacterized protein DUF748